MFIIIVLNIDGLILFFKYPEALSLHHSHESQFSTCWSVQGEGHSCSREHLIGQKSV